MAIALHILVLALGVYFAIGVVFGIYFLFRGAFQIDPLLKESKFSVRLLLLPGAIGLWPVLLKKIRQK